MFCPMCGAPNDDEAAFCGNCGAVLNADVAAADAPVAAVPAVPDEPAGAPEPVRPAPAEEWAVQPISPPPPPPPPPPPGPARYAPPAPTGPSVPVNGMAIAALVLGIARLSVIPLVGSILGLLFGYMARREMRQRPGATSGEGLAVAGIVLGWIGIGVLVLGLLIFGATLGCGLCGALGAAGSSY